MKASPFAILAVAGAASLLNLSPAQAQDMSLWFSCEANARDRALSALQQASPDPRTQAADLAAAQAAIAKAEKLNQDALAGLEVPAPYSGAAHWARRAAQASSPEIADLLGRVAKDQLLRFQWTIAKGRTHWATGLSDAALGYAYRIVALNGCGVDDANTAWLKDRVAAHGWFTIKAYGQEADQAAFLLVQHADRAPAFQAEMLTQLEKLALEGQTRPLNYAMLFDRVAVAQKRPQRYGSQGRCAGPGAWTAFETEDLANLDQRRASMGLQPHADYVAGISSRCK